MFKIKDVKKEGKRILKSNKWTLIVIALFMTIIIGEYSIAQDATQNGEILYNAFQSYKEGKQIDFVEETKGIIVRRAFNEALGQLVSGQTNTITSIIKNFNERHNVNSGIVFTIGSGFIKGQEQLQNLLVSIGNKDIDIKEKIPIILVGILAVLIKILIADPMIVGEKRIYLESINYPKTRITKLFYCFKKKLYFSTIKAMLLYRIYTLLWNLTIIGGIIKRYSYRMVQYIIAENPQIKPAEAIKISRKMMDGYKWETFKMDLSFAGWFILQYITFGLLGIYVTPYFTSTNTALYEKLRDEYVKKERYHFESLNDDVLYLKGNTSIYPGETTKTRQSLEIPKYGVISLILLFFFYSIFGWIWEVLLFLFEFGKLVNRGALYGPWLPIYGFGITGICLIFSRIKPLNKLMKNPVITFLIITVLCTLMEYFTSFALEKLWGLKYWDYEGIFLNINGRICFENSMFFGLGGLICLYVLSPTLERKISQLKIPKKVKIVIAVVLVTLILVDWGYTRINPHIGEYISSELTPSQRQENKQEDAF